MKKPILMLAAFLLVAADAVFATVDSNNVFENRTYPWYGQLVSLNQNEQTATITARIPAYVEGYINDFKTGDRLVLVWNMIGKTEATRVLGLWKWTPTSDTGYVLPITFVSADVPRHTMAFSIHVSEKAMTELRSIPAGEWIRVVTPMVQPTPEAVIKAVERTMPPRDDNEGAPAAVIPLAGVPPRSAA